MRVTLSLHLSISPVAFLIRLISKRYYHQLRQQQQQQQAPTSAASMIGEQGTEMA